MNRQPKQIIRKSKQTQKENITISVSKEFARLLTGYSMIRSETPEEYILSAVKSCIEADAGDARCVADAPEFVEASQ